MSKLDEIQARADAATEGPWFREYNDVVTSASDPDEDAAGFDDPQQLRIAHGARHLGQLDPVALKNAEFIAAARTDVEKLCAALRAVEAVHRNEHRDHLGRKSETPTERGGFCYGCGWYGGAACPMITAIREALK